ncbi:MAG: hypothetical protein INR63_25300 [Actinomycetospora chiangmaiensis]|nr:hypothetical protein [Actinomycetospora chiangmaiensis]
MIAALFALAAAMVIGGCAAVIQGFPYVRLESGLAMVIAGAVAASAGAILGGVGVLALGLRRVERAMGRDPARDAAEAVPAPAGEGRSRLPPVLPAAPAFLVPSVVEPSFDPERPRLDPAPDLGTEEPPMLATPAAAPSRPAQTGPDAAKPARPVSAPPISAPPISVPPKPDAPTPPRAIAPEDDLFAAPAAPPQPKDEPALRSSLDPAPVPAPKPATRTVVGRYASGGNTYVMFEDGSIEADTPQGRFTFASLDELKAFVDGGGESGTRGAA